MQSLAELRGKVHYDGIVENTGCGDLSPSIFAKTATGKALGI